MCLWFPLKILFHLDQTILLLNQFLFCSAVKIVPVFYSSHICFPSKLPMTASRWKFVPYNFVQMHRWNWHPPSRKRRSARSAVTLLPWDDGEEDEDFLMCWSSALLSTPRHPAGQLVAWIQKVRISAMRSAKPDEWHRLFARIIPSHSDESMCFSSVYQMARISAICISGRALSNWHFRRKLPVATIAFSGSPRNCDVDFFWFDDENIMHIFSF